MIYTKLRYIREQVIRIVKTTEPNTSDVTTMSGHDWTEALRSAIVERIEAELADGKQPERRI